MRPRTLIPLAIGGAAAAGMGWALYDYRAWRALGPGGLPSTWSGWLRTTRWRLAKKDPLATGPLAPHQGVLDDVAMLTDLPMRAGPRPRVGPHPVPHRQLTGHSPVSIRSEVSVLFERRAAGDPIRLAYALSHFERHNKAVKVREAFRRHAVAHQCGGEVGHVHPSDGSMHMILSPSDTRTVVEQNWGERHGLAGFGFGLPLTYTLIYAPRDERELATIARILDAAIGYLALDRPETARGITGN